MEFYGLKLQILYIDKLYPDRGGERGRIPYPRPRRSATPQSLSFVLRSRHFQRLCGGSRHNWNLAHEYDHAAHKIRMGTVGRWISLSQLPWQERCPIFDLATIIQVPFSSAIWLRVYRFVYFPVFLSIYCKWGFSNSTYENGRNDVKIMISS